MLRLAYALEIMRLTLVLLAARQARALASTTRFVTEYEVKKSKFIATATAARTWEDALAIIEQVADNRARHNCYAWQGKTSARSSDDGEPSGTAGKPIREAIASAGIENVVVIVTRYKPSSAPLLGAGGLIRAYGTAAREVLREFKEHAPDCVELVVIQAPLARLGELQALVAKWGKTVIKRRSETYDAYAVTLTLDVEPSRAEALRQDAVTALGPDALIPGEPSV